MPLSSVPLAFRSLPLMPDDPREASSLVGHLFGRFTAVEATLSDIKESLARQDVHIQTSEDWRAATGERLDRIEATAEKAAETLRFINALKAMMRWLGVTVMGAAILAGVEGHLGWMRKILAWLGRE